MARGDQPIDHLLRRAGFGAGASETARYSGMSVAAVIAALIDYQKQPADVDSHIGEAAYVGVATRGGRFSPNTSIEDARQRWLFRMIHSERPLQEKMTLFWHQHFATAYTKLAAFAPAVQATNAATRMTASSTGNPYLAFVNGTSLGAFATLDRVGSVLAYQPSAPYPDTAFGLALRTVAGAMARGTGTRVFFVATGGFDNHANEGNAGAGTYATLMATVNDGLTAFYTDLKNQGLLAGTLLLQFSEFGRRVPENGSGGTDHGAAGVMLALGGSVRGGLYGTAPSLDPDPANPTLENSGGDVRFETDFRSIYARVLDGWLGVDSVAVLGGNFRNSAPEIL